MKKVIARIFWIIVIVLMCIATFEFYRVRNGKKPLLCIKTIERTYVDGKSTECIGLGYKVFEYKRNYLKGTEFVSIFSKERKEDIDKEPVKEENNVEDTKEESDTNNDTQEGSLINEDIEVLD